MRFDTERIIKPFGFIINPLSYVLTYLFVKRKKIHRNLAKNVLVSSDWTEVIIQPPIRIQKHFQKIWLGLTNCKKHTNEGDLIFADGTTINPQKEIWVEIKNEVGNKFQLEAGSYLIGDYDAESEIFNVSATGFSNRLPKDKKYTTIRIRSDISFQCSISWSDYDLK